ncbi:HalOD1 output domain-containing protein [Halosimplex amylolyticum]|uniref:HalOD1 output domain-containing protein n=1 Tax=Halosimplex amylolyticum TaxID=3396616 RepID=UPI003F55B6C2
MSDCPTEGLEPVEYDDETSSFRAGFDSDQIAPSRAVVKLVSELGEQQSTEIEPLYAVVDPEALDSLCASHPLDSREGDCVVEFTYCDYHVTVKSYGYIKLQPLSVESE